MGKKEKYRKEIRFRFAPSPTGGLHIGTARTALFNWLATRSMGGKLVLRIEDTDLKRSSSEFESSIINDLKWMGLEWDEFYRQSERLEIYIKEAGRLIEGKKAYRCFCSPERLENLKNSLISEGKPSGYDNKCRDLSESEIEENIKNNKTYTVRYRVEPGEIIFNDIIRGEIRFSSDVISDFVLIKSDGTPSYNFAVVVDDNDMRISHVLRGEDHITNTARQIMLFKSLDYEIPEFAHLSMILGKDGSKLSKRHGATTITQYREEGYLKEAIVNYLSLLSWTPRTGEELFAPENIFEKFRLQDVSKNPAIFDIDRLNWINGNYIRMKNDRELEKLLLPFLSMEKNGLPSEEDNLKIYKLIDAFKDKIKTLKEFYPLAKDFFITEMTSYDEEAVEIIKTETAGMVINRFESEIKRHKEESGNEISEEEAKEIINKINQELKEFNIRGRFLYMPIRTSITGSVHGPELPKVVSILGADDCLKRIKQTKILIENNKKI